MDVSLKCFRCEGRDDSVDEVVAQIRSINGKDVVTDIAVCNDCQLFLQRPFFVPCPGCCTLISTAGINEQCDEEMMSICITCQDNRMCFVCRSSDSEVDLKFAECEIELPDLTLDVENKCICTACGKHDGVYMPCANIDCYVMVRNHVPHVQRQPQYRPRNRRCARCVTFEHKPSCSSCNQTAGNLCTYQVPGPFYSKDDTSADDHPMDAGDVKICPAYTRVLCDLCVHNPLLFSSCLNVHCNQLLSACDAYWPNRVQTDKESLCSQCKACTVCTMCEIAYSTLDICGRLDGLMVLPEVTQCGLPLCVDCQHKCTCVYCHVVTVNIIQCDRCDHHVCATCKSDKSMVGCGCAGCYGVSSCPSLLTKGERSCSKCQDITLKDNTLLTIKDSLSDCLPVHGGVGVDIDPLQSIIIAFLDLELPMSVQPTTTYLKRKRLCESTSNKRRAI
jgi:hypothetical protein